MVACRSLKDRCARVIRPVLPLDRDRVETFKAERAYPITSLVPAVTVGEPLRSSTPTTRKRPVALLELVYKQASSTFLLQELYYKLVSWLPP